MIVLDTNLADYAQRRVDPMTVRVKAALDADPDKELWITNVTAFEMANGAAKYVANAMRRQLDMVAAFRKADIMIDSSQVWHGRTLPYDEESRAIFDGFPAAMNRIARPDRWIAAIARRHDATVWTRNIVDFAKVPGLVVFDPVDGRIVDDRAGPPV